MGKFISVLDKSLYYIVSGIFLLLFAVNVINIALRSFTNTSLLWTIDFSQLLIVWIVALGAVVALSRNEHLAVGYLKQKFSKKIELSIDLITRLLFLVFYIIMVVTGIEIAQIRMEINYVTLDWPTGYAYWSMPVSGILMIFFVGVKLFEIVRQMGFEMKQKDS